MGCLVCEPGGPPAGRGVLEQIARASSPRVTPWGDTAVVFDVAGLSRVCGPPAVIAREVVAQAEACGLTVRLAIAGTSTAAWILAHARAGTTLVPPGHEAATLAPLPLGWLLPVIDLDRSAAARMSEAVAPASLFRRGGRSGGRNYRMAPAPSPGPEQVAPMRSGQAPTASPNPGARQQHSSPDRRRGDDAERTHRLKLYAERLATFERWGIRTCADLVALPRADIHARMGSAGVRLHQAASGEDVAPFVPVAETRLFADRVELEWPIEGLEPLSFVLARQCERLSTTLEQADRGAVAIHTTLTLVTRETYTRVLALPAPMRDAKVLRTLILLDLESHPPSAAIDVVDLHVDVTPGRIVQGSLLTRAVPSPEQASTLVARLTALAGEGRVGSPVLLDTHDPRQCAIKPFRVPSHTTSACGVPDPTPPRRTVPPHLRRLRLPMAARVAVAHGMPVRVVMSSQVGMGGGCTHVCGPLAYVGCLVGSAEAGDLGSRRVGCGTHRWHGLPAGPASGVGAVGN
jgi:hypothetical protein